MDFYEQKGLEKVKVIGQSVDGETAYNCALSLIDMLTPEQKAELVASLSSSSA